MGDTLRALRGASRQRDANHAVGVETIQNTDVQETRIIIENVDSGDSHPLQREQFEALAEHTREALDGYGLDRLPPKAEPYAAMLALHPQYVLDEREGTLTELDEADESAALNDAPHLSMSAGADDEHESEREEPDIDVYADMLLLIDALEREDFMGLDEVGTLALVNLYTLLSDVQRNANALRKDVTDVLLDRSNTIDRRTASTGRSSA